MAFKIAIINRHPDDFLGGSEMQCDNIASGLHARGHDVLFIAPAGENGKEYKCPYKVLPVANKPATIAAAVVDFSPDAVYWRFNKYGYLRTVRAIAGQGIPVIFAASHISDLQWWSSRENPSWRPVELGRYIKQGVLNMFNHFGHRYINAATTNNPDYMDLLPSPNRRLVRNAVDGSAVDFIWPRPFVLWVANIKTHKQPEKYIALARALTDTGVDFLMVGTIQSKSYDWIREEGRRLPNFHYLGTKTPAEVNGMLAQSLMLVHTCKPEGFGNNFIQAWLQGKPAVSLSFDPGGYIEKHDLGYFSGGDDALFAAQVRTLLEQPELAREMGRKALDFAKLNFSIETMAAEVEGLVYDVLLRRSKVSQ